MTQKEQDGVDDGREPTEQKKSVEEEVSDVREEKGASTKNKPNTNMCGQPGPTIDAT